MTDQTPEDDTLERGREHAPDEPVAAAGDGPEDDAPVDAAVSSSAAHQTPPAATRSTEPVGRASPPAIADEPSDPWHAEDGAPWPSGWGSSPPVWYAPQASATPRRRRRWPLGLLAVILGTGLLAGGVAGAVIARATAGSNASTTLVVDNRPAPDAGTNAASVANQTLGPAVGTVVANLSGSGRAPSQRTPSPGPTSPNTPTNAAIGSAFVIGHDSTNQHSYMLTNSHVVQGATDLHVVMPKGQNLKASVVGTDTLDDLAVVSVDDASLPVATFGDSDQLKVGQPAIAIGSALGNDGSVTEGVISALHRTITAAADNAGNNQETLQDVLQTDAAINHGNSGGPLADSQGHVIGVNVALEDSAQNVGFSIPANKARIVAQQLIERKAIQHPFLGIRYLTSIDATVAGHGFDGPGVYIDQVVTDSPAAKAGIQGGDIITQVAGQDIDNGQTLGGYMQKYKVGDSVDFSVKRGGQTLHVSATLIDRPADTPQQR